MDENIKIIHWNCRKVGNKKSEFKQFIKENKIHIILLNKTHLTRASKFNMLNYYIYRNDRIYATNVGGTAILIKNNIIHHQINIQTLLDNTTVHVMIDNQET